MRSFFAWPLRSITLYYKTSTASTRTLSLNTVRDCRCHVLFWVVFSSVERSGTEVWEFASIFCSTERNSELFSLPLKGLERNSDNWLLFLFHGTEFRVVFSSAEGSGTEFWEFSVPRNSLNSVGYNHLFRLFRLLRNYFLSGIPNHKYTEQRV